jgi:hypothetical protein
MSSSKPIQTPSYAGPLPVAKHRTKSSFNILEDKRPIPFDIEKRIPSYNDEMLRVLNEHEDKKRSFSVLSAESVTILQEAKKTHPGISQAEWEKAQQEKLSSRFDQQLGLLESHRVVNTQALMTLRGAMQRGEITPDEYQLQTEDLEYKLSEIRVQLISARHYRNQILGGCLDELLRMDHTEAVDHSYIDLLIQRVQPPHGMTVQLKERRKGQNELRKDMIAKYRCISPDDSELVWCCVSRQFWSKDEVIAAHLVPHSIGELNARYLFGELEDHKEGHLMSVRNVLPLAGVLEKAMDQARIAIVPAMENDDDVAGNPNNTPEDLASPNRYKVVVLDRGFLKGKPPGHCGIQDWSRLDGRLLRFRSDFRPGNRYLYFTLMLSILRRRRYQVDGWQSNFIRFAGGQYWGSPGPYLRTSTMSAMARRIGCVDSLRDLFGDASLLLEGADDDEATEKDKLVSDVVEEETLSVSEALAELPGMESDEEPDY